MSRLQCRVVEDGYFVPGGQVSRQDLVYDANRTLVVESTLWRKHTRGWVNHLASEAPAVLPRQRLEERTEHTLLFLGPYRTPRYGHWITEGLARFWYLLGPAQADADRQRVPVKSESVRSSLGRLLSTGRFPSWTAAFQAFQLTRRTVRTAVPLRGRVIVPDCSMRLNACIRKEHSMVTRKIASHLLAGERPPSDPTPVYLSRTKARHTSRVFHGELEIENYCRRRGFRIVYPERMSLRRQVRLFNAHNVFLGIQGSAFPHDPVPGGRRDGAPCLLGGRKRPHLCTDRLAAWNFLRLCPVRPANAREGETRRPLRTAAPRPRLTLWVRMWSAPARRAASAVSSVEASSITQITRASPSSTTRSAQSRVLATTRSIEPTSL